MVKSNSNGTLIDDLLSEPSNTRLMFKNKFSEHDQFLFNRGQSATLTNFQQKNGGNSS